jgi:Protein of unknown function (DUF3017)
MTQQPSADRRTPQDRRTLPAGGGHRKATPAEAADQGGETARGTKARIGQLSYWFVLVGAVAALVIIRQGVGFLKDGTLVLAGVLLVAATVRLVLPERAAGMLSSRARSVDVAILTILGAGLLVAGIAVPAP